MIFVFKKWESFCKKISLLDVAIKPAYLVTSDDKKFFVFKHDVETKVSKALKMSKIEHKYGIRGSYYVQAYLLKKEKNIRGLKEIQKLGHEVSYHHDVMDSCHGDLKLADVEFDKNKHLFEKNGFDIITVCQHGNPLIERNGYNSNRDFFRNLKTQKKYQNISDIMVNYKEKYSIEYSYYSDAGRVFKKIYDPINNDIVDTSNKDICYSNLDEVISSFEGNIIISTHPHRWCSSSIIYAIKLAAFKTLKFIAKLLYKVPFLRPLFSKYYYLAKKI